jgi:hypothetical protein
LQDDLTSRFCGVIQHRWLNGVIATLHSRAATQIALWFFMRLFVVLCFVSYGVEIVTVTGGVATNTP